ncbi:MAG: hypothetical protein ABIC82_04160 [bacterium]
MNLRKSLNFVLASLFCFCLAVLPGCWDGDGGNSNLPDVPAGELGGDVRVSFDFKNETQQEVATREKSQNPRDYVLNSFLKEKIEGVEMYIYHQNAKGECDYYGYWYVPIVNGVGGDEKFLKSQDYKFETWTVSSYGRSFTATEYHSIKPHTVNQINLLFQRTSELVVPFCIVNPFGVYDEGESYEIKRVQNFYMWESYARCVGGELYFSVLAYEPYNLNEIEFVIFAGTERTMHAFVDIMDIISGNPIPLQVTEVPMGSASINAEFDFENNAPTITIASPSEGGPAISASHFSLQGTAYPSELLQVTMKNGDGLVLWDAPKVVSPDGTFEIDVPLTKAPLQTTFTVTVEVGYENWPSLPVTKVDVAYQPPIPANNYVNVDTISSINSLGNNLISYCWDVLPQNVKAGDTLQFAFKRGSVQMAEGVVMRHPSGDEYYDEYYCEVQWEIILPDYADRQNYTIRVKL